MWYKIENNTLFLCELLHKKGYLLHFQKYEGKRRYNQRHTEEINGDRYSEKSIKKVAT